MDTFPIEVPDRRRRRRHSPEFRAAVKVLVHDGIGVWLCARRLHQGSFTWAAPGTRSPSGPREAAFSELPMRQRTLTPCIAPSPAVSELPMRQRTGRDD